MKNIKRRIYKLIYYIGLISIIIFGIDALGFIKKEFNFQILNLEIDLVIIGISFFSLVPEYYINAKDWENETGKISPVLRSYYLFSVFFGIVVFGVYFLVQYF